MLGKSENKKQGFNGDKAVFKHYKVMVKILQENKVEYQNLEIFTTGLPQLLEMRRIHNHTFGHGGFACVLENSRNN
jgi:hypothetical protein